MKLLVTDDYVPRPICVCEDYLAAAIWEKGVRALDIPVATEVPHRVTMYVGYLQFHDNGQRSEPMIQEHTIWNFEQATIENTVRVVDPKYTYKRVVISSLDLAWVKTMFADYMDRWDAGELLFGELK